LNGQVRPFYILATPPSLGSGFAALMQCAPAKVPDQCSERGRDPVFCICHVTIVASAAEAKRAALPVCRFLDMRRKGSRGLLRPISMNYGSPCTAPAKVIGVAFKGFQASRFVTIVAKTGVM
jgi:hypothetical protein